MNAGRRIWYTCDLCGVEVKVVQLPEGCWIDKDLSGCDILLPDGDRPPMPCFWVEYGDKYYCPDHKLVFHGWHAKDGKAEHFYAMRGLKDGIRAVRPS